MKVEMIVRQIEEIEVEYPFGYTLDLESMEIVTKVYPVGFIVTQGAFGNKGLQRCVRHALENDRHLGMWVNGEGIKQYDSVRIFTDLTLALEFARANDQEAIWDLAEMKEIKC
jgi:hypothetical protein